MSKPNDTFQTIDPTALTNVQGGAGSGSSTTDDQLMSALGGIADSLSALAKEPARGSSFSMQDMCMFMIALNANTGPAPAAPCAPQPKAWNWNNGVWTPTY